MGCHLPYSTNRQISKKHAEEFRFALVNNKEKMNTRAGVTFINSTIALRSKVNQNRENMKVRRIQNTRSTLIPTWGNAYKKENLKEIPKKEKKNS